MQRIKPTDAVVAIPVPQSSESTALSRPREKRQLDGAELDQFLVLMEQMWAHYPNQEFSAETVESYQFDMERLAAIQGLQAVKTALLALRIRPGQRFFPHPSEVAEELEAMAVKARDEARARNPYVPDPQCRHQSPGWAWVIDKDGDRVMGRCDCWKQWKGQAAVREHKPAVAGA